MNRSKSVKILSKTVVIVAGGGTGETCLKNGENEYPFSVTIPEDAESSFHYLIGYGEHGTVNISILWNKSSYGN